MVEHHFRATSDDSSLACFIIESKLLHVKKSHLIAIIFRSDEITFFFAFSFIKCQPGVCIEWIIWNNWRDDVTATQVSIIPINESNVYDLIKEMDTFNIRIQPSNWNEMISRCVHWISSWIRWSSPLRSTIWLTNITKSCDYLISNWKQVLKC